MHGIKTIAVLNEVARKVFRLPAPEPVRNNDLTVYHVCGEYMIIPHTEHGKKFINEAYDYARKVGPGRIVGHEAYGALRTWQASAYRLDVIYGGGLGAA